MLFLGWVLVLACLNLTSFTIWTLEAYKTHYSIVSHFNQPCEPWEGSFTLHVHLNRHVDSCPYQRGSKMTLMNCSNT